MFAAPALLQRFRAFTFLISSIGLSICASSAQSAVITYATPKNSSINGQPVSAEVSVETLGNTIQLVLTNKQANPTNSTQCLSGVQFRLSTGQTSGTVMTSSAMERIIGNGTYTDGGFVETGWTLARAGSDLLLDDSQGAPKHTIIGPSNLANPYASGSSALNDNSHNPYLANSATFTLSVPGVTAASSIKSVAFQFNTSDCSTIPGVVVPEPVEFALLATTSLVISRRRRAA